MFGYWVRDPERYGVAEFDAQGRVVGLEEKPAQPKPAPGRQDVALASMGIYAFSADFLYAELQRDFALAATARSPAYSRSWSES